MRVSDVRLGWAHLGLQLFLVQNLEAFQIKEAHCQAQSSSTCHSFSDLQEIICSLLQKFFLSVTHDAMSYV